MYLLSTLLAIFPPYSFIWHPRVPTSISLKSGQFFPAVCQIFHWELRYLCGCCRAPVMCMWKGICKRIMNVASTSRENYRESKQQCYFRKNFTTLFIKHYCIENWKNQLSVAFQLIEHQISRIPNILFAYFLSNFPDKSFELISKYTQKCQYNSLYYNTLNWGN